MNQQTQPNKSAGQQAQTPAPKPNETGAFSIEGHIKIFDPSTKEIFVEKRA
jgi:hypothetical protein